MKYCKNCKYISKQFCAAPLCVNDAVAPMIESVVDGKYRLRVLCAIARRDDSMCGNDSKHYSETLWFKIRNWFNSP